LIIDYKILSERKMMSSFKALYMQGPKKLVLKEVQLPDKVKDDKVLIKLKAVGICGSDVECYIGHSKEGRYDLGAYVPGHEWAGEVVDTGDAVKVIKKGNKVVSDVCFSCGVCENCKDGLNPCYCLNMRETGFMPDAPGGMGEYMVIEEKLLHRLSPEMTFEEGALVEPFSVSYHGIWGDGGWVDASDSVVVFGAGPIGLFAAVVAKVAGAYVITVDPVEFRRKIAQDNLGIDKVIDPKKDNVVDAVMDLTGGRGATLVVECSGNDEALANTVEVAKQGGRINFIGHSIGRKVSIEIGLSIWKGLHLAGKCAAPFFFPRTIKFMAQAKKIIDFTKIITHRYPLEKYQEAFDMAVENKDEAVKILLTM
jgi:L-iditol 2-dehydrogenase